MQQRDNASTRQCNNATMYHRDNTTTRQCNNATMQQRDNATTRQCNNATMQQRDNATTRQCNNATMQQRDDVLRLLGHNKIRKIFLSRSQNAVLNEIFRGNVTGDRFLALRRSRLSRVPSSVKK